MDYISIEDYMIFDDILKDFYNHNIDIVYMMNNEIYPIVQYDMLELNKIYILHYRYNCLSLLTLVQFHGPNNSRNINIRITDQNKIADIGHCKFTSYTDIYTYFEYIPTTCCPTFK